MHRTRRRRSAVLRILAIALTGTGSVGLFFSHTAPAGADSVAANVALASATGVQARYTVPDYFVVTEYFNGGGPTAQSVVDRSGRSTGYAALPYPGDNVVAAPGLLAVGSGQSVPVSYPLYVQANHPQVPKSETKDPTGTYSLVSEADATKAVSDAALRFGDSVSESASHAESVFDGEQAATAMATTTDRGISIGHGTLRIASVKSRSIAGLQPGAARASTSSELLIEGATVGGRPVTIDREGVHYDQTSVPLAGGSAPAEDGLKQAGITVSVLAGGPVGDGTGSNSDVLLVTVKHPIPAPGNPQGLFEFRFGGASTFLTLGAGPDLVGLPGPGTVPTPAGAAPAAGPPGADQAGDGGLPAAGLPTSPSTAFSAGPAGGASRSPAVDGAFPSGSPFAPTPEPTTPDGLAAPSLPAAQNTPAANTRPALQPLHSVEFAYIVILVAGLLFGATHWIIGSREMRPS